MRLPFPLRDSAHGFLFALGVVAGACGGAQHPATTPHVVDSRTPDRRAIERVLAVLEEADGPTAYDLARGFLEEFPASPYVVTAHGVVAYVALGSDSPETAREPLEAIVRSATDPLTLATAHYELALLAVPGTELDSLGHALAAHAAIQRVPEAAVEWNETFVMLVPGAILTSSRVDPSTAEGVVSLVDASGFDTATRDAILRVTSELALIHARFSLVLGLERALGVPSNASRESCETLARLTRASGYGGGALSPAEVAAAESCGIAATMPIRIDAVELMPWVDVTRAAVERCAATARDRRRGGPYELVLEAGSPAPHFATTGLSTLDRCLANAISSATVVESRIQRPSAFSVRSSAPLLSIPISDDPY